MASGYKYDYSDPYAWADSANVDYVTDSEYKAMAQDQYDAEEAKQEVNRANQTYKYNKQMQAAEAQGREAQRKQKEQSAESVGRGGRSAKAQSDIQSSVTGEVGELLTSRDQMNAGIDAGLAQTFAELQGQAKAASEKERQRLSNMMYQSKAQEDARIAQEEAAAKAAADQAARDAALLDSLNNQQPTAPGSGAAPVYYDSAGNTYTKAEVDKMGYSELVSKGITTTPPSSNTKYYATESGSSKDNK